MKIAIYFNNDDDRKIIGDPASYKIDMKAFQKPEHDCNGIPVLVNDVPIGVVHSIHKGLANVSLWIRFLESEMVDGKTVALAIPSEFRKKVEHEQQM